jgi:uncharacterized protein YhbP (UPF0306 family)
MTLSNDSKPAPGGQELKRLAVSLLAEQTTMTLATADDNSAWSAPVYYVFFNSAFYFLSDPKSRHIQQSLQFGRAAASVHAAASTWQAIRGVQMSGRVQPVAVGREALQVLRAYLAKYPFTREFFPKNSRPDLASFSDRFGVRLYKFVPSLVYYLDNQIRFAFRAEVKL